MHLKVYQGIVRRHASLAPEPRLEAYRSAARRLTGPLSAWERQISKAPQSSL
jgi:hypothetical protein